MKTSRGTVQCQGACMWYWNGTQWNGPNSTCSAGCGCSATPPPPPPNNTPPFYQFLQCIPSHGQAKPTTVRIHVGPKVEVCLFCLPNKRRSRRK